MILDIFNFIILIILIFLTIVIFLPINTYKKLKTKEEQLFCQKTFITALFFLLILLINILAAINGSSLPLYLLTIFSFNIYIIIISLYNFFISFELYSTFTNPVHFFNRLLKQKQYNYFEEFIIFIIGIIILIFDLILFSLGVYEIKKDNIRLRDFKDDDKDNYYYCNDSSLFIIIGGKSFFLLIICIISLFIYSKSKTKIQNFSFKNQDKVIKIIEKRTLSIYLYIVYGLYYILPIVVGSGLTEIYNTFGNIFFLFIIFNDFIIHISIIATSKFCEYRLKKTILGYFCSFFFKIPKYNSGDTPLITPHEPSGLSLLNNVTKSVSEINTNNVNDKELVSSFKNGIFIEDYFLGFFDQILNIITSSMFEAYNSKFFSSQANEKTLNNNIKIGDISSITGTMQNITVSNFGNVTSKAPISCKNEIGDDIISFTMTKNNEKDEFQRYKEVLESEVKINNYNNYLNINLKSFFTQKCVESIYNQKLKGKQIGSSLLNHMILANSQKNINLNNPNSYFWSLLAANVKEEHFNKLNCTSIKTFDKIYTLDIFDTDDEEININNKIKTSNLAILLDKYFTYINAKGIKGTFIPSLVGVFKIKINDFKTLLVFVTRNSLVDNVPKNYFTYWQLIQFSKDNPSKIASSQNNDSLVKDDPIFDRSFQIETIKENPDYNKIFIKHYFDFSETLKKDILFLHEIGAQSFNLLLMYYEYENTKKHENQGTIKIKETNDGAELIEESLIKGLEDDKSIGATSKSGADRSESFDCQILNFGDEIMDEDFGKNFNNKKGGNMIDIDEKVSITGYEGIFDSFNCLCFFTFENVFDNRKRFYLGRKYHDIIENKILVHFTDFKK